MNIFVARNRSTFGEFRPVETFLLCGVAVSLSLVVSLPISAELCMPHIQM